MLAEGADAAVMTRSVPIDKCLSDALIVFAQNGEAIRPEQGYPMRLFLPGWEGNISIKWLRRLEVSDKPFYTREETSKYTDLITRTGKARIFTFTMDAKSVITFPVGRDAAAGGRLLRDHRPCLVRSRQDRARRDLDRRRQDLAAWRRCRIRFCRSARRASAFRGSGSGAPAVLQSRATDETGYTQPTHQQLIAERGPLEAPGMFYHMNAIQSWGVARRWEREECPSARLRRRVGRAGAICARLRHDARIGARPGLSEQASTSASRRREQDIARLAIAIPADGKGLPPGRGDYAKGKQVYEIACAACHGADLKGVAGLPDMPSGAALRLIGGRGTLTSQKPIVTVESYWPYATTLFDYIRRAMPFMAPGSLSDDEVYAVSAYILAEANIIDKATVLDAQSLPKVVMPNRDGFISDPRPELFK